MIAMDEPPDAVDFDLHGLVGVRLLQPRSGDVTTVRRQLGLTPTTLERPPDLTVRFTERLPSTGVLRILGAGTYGYDDRDFFVLTAAGERGRRRTALRFESLGQPGAEVVCEHGVAPVPLLMDLLNLTALGAGVLPLHASAFIVDGCGVLVTGWAKGGKTETLLGFVAAGAEHVGDEWVYLPGDRRMLGIPEPMRVWQWHLDDLPVLRRRLSRRDRARLSVLQRLETVVRSAARGGPSKAVMGRVADVVGRQRFVHVPPRSFFRQPGSALAGSLDAVFLTVTHDDPRTTVAPSSGPDVAQRMVASLHLERTRLREAYRHSLFAFPDRRCAALETATEREHTLLHENLSQTAAYEVRHPYPVDIPAVVRAMRPFVPGR